MEWRMDESQQMDAPGCYWKRSAAEGDLPIVGAHVYKWSREYRTLYEVWEYRMEHRTKKTPSSGKSTHMGHETKL